MMIGRVGVRGHVAHDLLGERARPGSRCRSASSGARGGRRRPGPAAPPGCPSPSPRPRGGRRAPGSRRGARGGRRRAARRGPARQNRRVASSCERPSRTIWSRIMSAMPSPAVPAPWMTTRWSRIRDPAARTAENAAASTTAAVPCMSSLNVQHLVGVAVEDPPGVGRAEVLPVQHRVREQLLARGDVGVDELVVALVADPGVPLAQVHLVVEQVQVVGAHVEHHRQHPAEGGCRPPRCRPRACRRRSRCRRRPGRRCRGCPRSRWPRAGRRPRRPARCCAAPSRPPRGGRPTGTPRGGGGTRG